MREIYNNIINDKLLCALSLLDNGSKILQITCDYKPENMRKTLLAFFFTLAGCALYGQANTTWVAFDETKDLTYTGFKDGNGTIKIPPVFTGRTIARKFDNIIAAMEFVDNRYTEPFYITKTGTILKDSVYAADYAFDCESEGYIRFKDKKTGNTGMLNGNAKVVIPATYSDLGRVYNGLIVGLKGAKKQVDNQSVFWEGGNKQLLDVTNKVLVDSLTYEGHLNFYSLKVTDKNEQENFRHYFKGTDGKYYSFTDFEENLKWWVSSVLLKELTKEGLTANTLNTIKYEDSSKEWKTEDKNSFIARNFEHIKHELQQLTLNSGNYSIRKETIVKHIFEPATYSKYYNNCDEIKYWQNPVMSISLQKNKAVEGASRFYFIYTELGYKLIGISEKNSDLK
jgi:hypothetical protein